MCSCSKDLQTAIETLTYDVKNVLTCFRINSIKATPERFQFMIVSRTRRPQYNLLIDSNVRRVCWCGNAGINCKQAEFWKTYYKIMLNSIMQTPCTHANKKILNIRKSQSLGKRFYGFSIQLCASRKFA